MEGKGTFTDQKFTARASGGVPFPVIYGPSLSARNWDGVGKLAEIAIYIERISSARSLLGALLGAILI